jgi:hypothetical protein
MFEHHQQRQTDRVGHERLVLGVDALPGADDWLGHVCAQRFLTSRLAERSMSRQTRATTVVSRPVVVVHRAQSLATA